MMLEFCAGGAVGDIMQELLKPLAESQIAYVTHFVCEALAYLHSIHVIHRDLKAGNVLLTGDGTVKLGELSSADGVCHFCARFCAATTRLPDFSWCDGVFDAILHFSRLWCLGKDEGRK